MPPNEQQLATALAHIGVMSADMAEVKASIREMAAAVTKLAVLDERQVADRGAIERAFKEIEKQDGRIKSLEDAQPMQRQASDWVHKAVGQIVSLVVAALAGAVISTQVVRAPEPKTPPAKTEAQRTTQ